MNDTINLEPESKLKTVTYAGYNSNTPMFGMINGKDRVVTNLFGCREQFCSSYRSQRWKVGTCGRAVADSYALFFKCGDARRRTTYINKMKRALAFLNGLEEQFAMELTRATVYADAESFDFNGRNLNESNKAIYEKMIGEQLAFVVEVDEIWTSAPPLLSLHMLLLRLPFSTVIPAAVKTFTDLQKLIDEGKLKQTRDGSYVRNMKKYLAILDNLMEIFGDKTAKDSWFYPGYSSVHGISSFCNSVGLSGGDKEAKQAYNKLAKSLEK